VESRDEVHQNFAGPVQNQREVAVVGQEPCPAVRQSCIEPAPMGRGHHEVLFALPEKDGRANAG
jgi:hypothetical protein